MTFTTGNKKIVCADKEAFRVIRGKYFADVPAHLWRPDASSKHVARQKPQGVY